MSIQDEINRISQAKDDLASAIESKGVTVPPNTTINLYPGLVQQIQQGDSLPEGGGGSMELISTTGLTTWAEGGSISIPNLLDYDAVGIVPLTNGATAADEYGSMNIYPVTSNERTYTLSGININSSKYAETCMRLITIVSNAIVSASGGYFHNWGNRGQSDQCAVPAYIYGIKY